MTVLGLWLATFLGALVGLAVAGAILGVVWLRRLQREVRLGVQAFQFLVEQQQRGFAGGGWPASHGSPPPSLAPAPAAVTHTPRVRPPEPFGPDKGDVEGASHVAPHSGDPRCSATGTTPGPRPLPLPRPAP